jgi:hypothetical protein
MTSTATVEGARGGPTSRHDEAAGRLERPSPRRDRAPLWLGGDGHRRARDAADDARATHDRGASERRPPRRLQRVVARRRRDARARGDGNACVPRGAEPPPPPRCAGMESALSIARGGRALGCAREGRRARGRGHVVARSRRCVRAFRRGRGHGRSRGRARDRGGRASDARAQRHRGQLADQRGPGAAHAGLRDRASAHSAHGQAHAREGSERAPGVSSRRGPSDRSRGCSSRTADRSSTTSRTRSARWRARSEHDCPRRGHGRARLAAR